MPFHPLSLSLSSSKGSHSVDQQNSTKISASLLLKGFVHLAKRLNLGKFGSPHEPGSEFA